MEFAESSIVMGKCGASSEAAEGAETALGWRKVDVDERGASASAKTSIVNRQSGYTV